MRRLFGTSVMLAAAIVVGGPAAAQGDPHLTVEQLLNDGWKVAG